VLTFYIATTTFITLLNIIIFHKHIVVENSGQLVSNHRPCISARIFHVCMYHRGYGVYYD
jgi:hypothetical protein